MLAALCQCSGQARRELRECEPGDLPSARGRITAFGLPAAGDPPTELTVVGEESGHLRFEADPAADPPDERTLDIDVGELLPDAAALPPVGDRVVVRGGLVCDSGAGYARVEDLDGRLLFEGGDPRCGAKLRPGSYEPPLFLTMQRAADPQLDSGCRSEAWEVTLTVDGGGQVLPYGELREVDIDGRRYAAEAQYGREYIPCDVIAEGDTVSGSAYLVLLGT